MPRISYVDPATVTDPELHAHLERGATRGTPRPESLAIRAHVPEILRTFCETWDASFYGGAVDHEIKELCRVYVSKVGACEYCGTQRSQQTRALGERDYDELLDFPRQRPLRRPPEGGARLDRRDPVGPQQRGRRAVGAAAPTLQRTRARRARVLHRADARSAALVGHPGPVARAGPGEVDARRR